MQITRQSLPPRKQFLGGYPCVDGDVDQIMGFTYIYIKRTAIIRLYTLEVDINLLYSKNNKE